MLWHTPKNGALLRTQLIRFEGNKFEIKIAQAKQEIVKLLEAGFKGVGKDADSFMIQEEKLKK